METKTPTVGEVKDLLPSLAVEATGSRVICPPAIVPIGSDYDFAVLASDLKSAFDTLIARDFTAGESMNGESEIREGTKFLSLKRGLMNVIVTADKEFHDLFMLATRTATKLGLNNRQDRITLFQAILYRNG